MMFFHIHYWGIPGIPLKKRPFGMRLPSHWVTIECNIPIGPNNHSQSLVNGTLYVIGYAYEITPVMGPKKE